MLDQTELERRLNRLPTRRWWLGFMAIITVFFSALLLFGEKLRAAIGG